MEESKFLQKADEVSEYLRNERNSESKAIKSGVLCELFNLHKEEIRSVVNYLRSKGVPVCSSCTGYWYSEDIRDIDKTLSHLEGRVKGINRAIKGLKMVREEKE